MKRILAPVVSNEEVMRGVHLLWAEAPAVASAARPGQFVMVKASDDCDPLLRRPLSIHRVGKKGTIALLIEVIGRGTEWLAQRQVGEQLDLLGPLGNGFDVHSKDLLLVAGGCGIAPLVFLAERALTKGRHMIMVVGASGADRVYPRRLLPPDLAIVTVTEDGSLGERGVVCDLLPELASARSQVLVCGPLEMYRAMAALDCIKGKSVQVSLEARMGCGFGCCFGCTIETRRGLKRVCRDGPVFELADLLL